MLLRFKYTLYSREANQRVSYFLNREAQKRYSLFPIFISRLFYIDFPKIKWRNEKEPLHKVDSGKVRAHHHSLLAPGFESLASPTVNPDGRQGSSLCGAVPVSHVYLADPHVCTSTEM